MLAAIVRLYTSSGILTTSLYVKSSSTIIICSLAFKSYFLSSSFLLWFTFSSAYFHFAWFCGSRSSSLMLISLKLSSWSELDSSTWDTYIKDATLWPIESPCLFCFFGYEFFLWRLTCEPIEESSLFGGCSWKHSPSCWSTISAL